VGRTLTGGYGEGAKTTGVVILRDGAVVAERYAAGWGPFTSNRTWSAGKSLAGTLIGHVVMRPGPVPLRPSTAALWPRAGDPRGGITLDHLLRMSSGLHSDTAGNRTDAIYFGGTAVDEQALGWPLAARPGTRFRYANNDTLLAAYMMRLALGDDMNRLVPLALLAKIGMAHTDMGADWRGNYILSSQVWSTARDLARLGQFWLQDGVWQGERLLPTDWMRYMTTPSGPQPATGPGYGATLWLFGPKQGLPEGSYAAQGNRGQYIMVIPSAKLVIVRRGEDPGAARFDIAKFSADVLAATR
jgi:CubicO group peptidase (beta-lactamase class C family)